MVTDIIEPFSMVERDLLDRGYEPGMPDPECERDRDTAESARCIRCGAPLSFAPFTEWEPEERHIHYGVVGVRSNVAVYRAFAVCRKCDMAAELIHIPARS